MAKKKAKKAAKRPKATRKAAKKTTKKKVVKKTAKKSVAKKKTAKRTAAKSTKSAKKKAAAKRTTTKRKTTPRQVSPKKPAKPVPPKGSKATPHPLIGKIAPDFELVDGAHAAHRLSDYRGQIVVLYFYPRDNTPGCTKEACGFNETRSQFKKRNVVILGVSPDTAISHAKFAEKFGLQFPLLADPEHAVAEMYGAWGEKNMYGRVTYGILRTTYVIGADGRVQHVFEKVKAEGHEQEVLAYLDKA